jgi:exopolysaccharide biosynthesis polyprenyl glycosylphosphotransferase
MHDIPRRFFWIADLICLATAFAWAYLLAPQLQLLFVPGGPLRQPWLEFLSPPGPEVIGRFRPLGDQLWMLLTVAPVSLLMMEMLGGYQSLARQSRLRIVVSSLAAPLIGLSALTLIVFALRVNQWSRLVAFLFAALTGLGFAGYRLALRFYRQTRAERGHYARNVALIGSPAGMVQIASHFTRHISPIAYRLVGYFGPDLASEGPVVATPGTGAPARTLPRLGSASDLGHVLIHQPIHEVIGVLSSSGTNTWLDEVMQHCDYFRVTVRLVPEALLGGSLRDLEVIFRTDRLRLPEIVLRPPELDSDALFLKRVIDILVSGTLLLLLAPLFALIAIAIKLTTPHLPVLYRWNVVGYKGERFTGYKFTTMVADADERKADLMHLNEMTGPVFKIKDDPRVTALGRWLRKFSLNELPQLWSVLKGDMSLVGPRPAGPHELVAYDLWHKRKLSVRPGITCLWQVSGRNRINDFDDWVRLDLEYIDNWSLWLDLRILWRTAWTVVGGTGS